MGKKRKTDPETLARWAQEEREFREMYERRLERHAAWEAAEARRKERLRRLTFGLLGRA
jgi:hypothetical protein